MYASVLYNAFRLAFIDESKKNKIKYTFFFRCCAVFCTVIPFVLAGSSVVRKPERIVHRVLAWVVSGRCCSWPVALKTAGKIAVQ
ncbi:hypothetical protein J1N35_024059 [Gossypium stocksii]|uniref:Uncharacterized protein n=1 Tax=Gossypium stocksii TaxID=47602 RepID=A0A9D3VJN6_9ROSI|nr:hypothetical protein J1N35_024059 [Gossypium stocksii]